MKTSFKYLGVYFFKNGNWHRTQKWIAEHASKAMHRLFSVFQQYEFKTSKKYKLFDALFHLWHTRKPRALSPLGSICIWNEVDLVPLACEGGVKLFFCNMGNEWGQRYWANPYKISSKILCVKNPQI